MLVLLHFLIFGHSTEHEHERIGARSQPKKRERVFGSVLKMIHRHKLRERKKETGETAARGRV